MQEYRGIRRLQTVDVVRGLLMILMALDHTRDYFSSARVDPTDPLESWPALFATRWVTHLCAPGFVLLTGASVYLQRAKGKTADQTAYLLITRGVWFLLLDVTLISFGWGFTFHAPFVNIISTIGICMIGLSLLQYLPPSFVGIIGAAIVMFHNLLDPIKATNFGHFANFWILFHQRGFLLYRGRPLAMVLFPFLAWFGIMCVGYASGPVFMVPDAKRRSIMLYSALACVVSFTTLRFTQSYGDTYLFTRSGEVSRSVMSFLQVQKYPPSLQYTLATIGVLLLIYMFLDERASRKAHPRLRSVLENYGRVPLLFYVLHIYLIHAAALLTAFAVHSDWRFWIGPGFAWGYDSPASWGYGLCTVYGIWVGVIVALFLPCRSFGQVKDRRHDWWLSYL